MKKISLVAACCRSNGIGKNNDLPWRLKNEMAYFTRITSKVLSQNEVESGKKNAVIMGINTYMSIPPKYRPLPNRINVVLSRKVETPPEGAEFLFKSLESAVEHLSTLPQVAQLFIVGGAETYKDAIQLPICEFVFLTKIDADFDCDRFFPEVDEKIYEDLDEKSEFMKLYDIPTDLQNEKGLSYKYHLYRRRDL